MFFSILRLPAIPLVIVSATVAHVPHNVRAIFTVQNAESAAVDERDNCNPPNIDYIPATKTLMLHGTLALRRRDPEAIEKIKAELSKRVPEYLCDIIISFCDAPTHALLQLTNPVQNSKLTFVEYDKALFRRLRDKVDWFKESSESNEELMKAAWPRDGRTAFTVFRRSLDRPKDLTIRLPNRYQSRAVRWMRLLPPAGWLEDEKSWILKYSRRRGEALPLYKLFNTLKNGDIITWTAEGN